MSIKSYSYISVALFIDEIAVPDSNKPRMQLLLSTIDFPMNALEHPVQTSLYHQGTLTVGECVQLWGSAAHDGSMDGKLNIYATSLEQFPWAQSWDDDYQYKIPCDRGAMVTTHGRVETEPIDRAFVLTGTIWGDGSNRTFRWKIMVPSNQRWANLKLPHTGQNFGVRGLIDHRSEDGLYVIVVHDVSIPDNSTTTPSPSPAKKAKKNQKRPRSTQVLDAPAEFAEGAPSSTPASGTSGLSADQVNDSPTVGRVVGSTSARANARVKRAAQEKNKEGEDGGEKDDGPA